MLKEQHDVKVCNRSSSGRGERPKFQPHVGGVCGVFQSESYLLMS